MSKRKRSMPKKGDEKMPNKSKEGDPAGGLRDVFTAYLTNELAMPTPRLIFEFGANELTMTNNLIMAATTAVIERPVYSIDTPKKMKTFGDLMLDLDDEFNEAFRLSRTTIRSIVADLKTIPEYRQEDDSSVVKSVCLLAYFLANKTVTLEQMKKVFHMDSDDKVVDEMVRVSKALQDVSGRVRLRWPLENESLEIGERFLRKHKFPDVMGVMGYWIFGSVQDGILFQAVVDDMNMYLDINATEIVNSKPTPAEFYFRTATYSYVTNFLPPDFNVIATSAYPDRIPNVVTQYSGKSLSSLEKNFNDLISNCLDILKQSMRINVQRFPRLLKVDLPYSQAKHIILGSCVLHNASIFYHDLTVF